LRWIDDRDVLEGIWRAVSRSNKVLSLEDIGLPDIPEADYAIKFLALPVAWRESEPLGMLLLGSRPAHTFTRRQLLLLRTVAGQAALMIKNDRLMAQLEYRAVLDERNRLAREIHDGLAQTLAFLKLEAAHMQSHVAKGEVEAVSRTLRTCYQTLSDAYLDARQAIDNLRHTPHDELSAWLNMTADDFRTLTGMELEVSLEEPEFPFAPKVKAQLIRIVQEALTNVRKHARARAANISVYEMGGEAIFEVSDDGCGFSPDESRSTSQYGLRSMRERAESIGADFQIISAPGKGTTVRVQLPLKKEEARQ
jgi:two-component system nitrate/nitrite sensor histidine kinase NarX